MPNDDEEVRPNPALVAKPALDRLGIAELQKYVEGLREEIGRAEGEIARKTGLRSAADSFFRKP